jgi:predicted esterase
MMRRVSLICLGFTAFLTAVPTLGADELLRYELKPGWVYTYRLEFSDMTIDSAEDETLVQRTEGEWTIDVIAGTFNDEWTPLAYSGRRVFWKPVVYEHNGIDSLEQVRDRLQAMLDSDGGSQFFHEFVDSRGRTADGRGVYFGPYYNLWIGGFDAQVLPERPVTEGDEWGWETVYGSGRYTMSYRLVGYEECEGRRCVRIDGKLEVSPGRESASFPDGGPLRTSFLFDPKEGIMVRLQVETTGPMRFWEARRIVRNYSIQLASAGEWEAPEEMKTAVMEAIGYLADSARFLALERLTEAALAHPDEPMSTQIEENLWQFQDPLYPLYPAEDLDRVQADLALDEGCFDRALRTARSPDVRALSAYYLSLGDSKDAANALTDALYDESVIVRRAAAEGFLRLAIQGTAVPIMSLTDRLRDVDDVTRARIADAVAWASAEGDSALIPHLKGMMDDELPAIRWAGVSGLRNVDYSALLLPLWGLMNDPDPFLREYAARALEEEDERREALWRCGIDRSFGPPGGYGVARHAYRCEALDSQETCPLYVPPHYSPVRPWPLVVVLAGGGGDGEGYIRDWMLNLATRGYVAVAPVGGGRFWWQEGHHLVLSAIESVKRAYHIDDDRVYVAGMSNGGLGTYFLCTRFPGLFAGGCSIAGNPVNERTEDDDPLFLLNLMNLPFSLIHGALDNVIPIEADRVMRSRLDSLGYRVEYIEHEHLGHDMVYDSTGLNLDHEAAFDLFGFAERQPYAAQVNCVTDSVRDLGYAWIVPESLVPGELGVLRAEHDFGNEFTVNAESIEAFTLYFSDEMIDLGLPVRVLVNGDLVFEGRIEPDPDLCAELCERRADWGSHFYGKVTIQVP